MLDKYFSWSGWGSVDELVHVYYNVELLVDMGDLKVGSKFEFANLDYVKGILEFGNGDQILGTFKTSLNLERVQYE